MGTAHSRVEWVSELTVLPSSAPPLEASLSPHALVREAVEAWSCLVSQPPLGVAGRGWGELPKGEQEDMQDGQRAEWEGAGRQCRALLASMCLTVSM